MSIKPSTFFILFTSIFFIPFLSLSKISSHITFVESFKIVSNLNNSVSFGCDSLSNFFNELYINSILFLIVFFVSNKPLYLCFISFCLSIICALIPALVAGLLLASCLMLFFSIYLFDMFLYGIFLFNIFLFNIFLFSFQFNI